MPGRAVSSFSSSVRIQSRLTAEGPAAERESWLISNFPAISSASSPAISTPACWRNCFAQSAASRRSGERNSTSCAFFSSNWMKRRRRSGSAARKTTVEKGEGRSRYARSASTSSSPACLKSSGSEMSRKLWPPSMGICSVPSSAREAARGEFHVSQAPLPRIRRNGIHHRLAAFLLQETGQGRAGNIPFPPCLGATPR